MENGIKDGINARFRGKPASPHLGKAIFAGKTGQSEASSALMFPGDLWDVVSWPVPGR